MLAGTSLSMFPAVLLYITAIAAVYAPSAFNETGSNDLTGRSLLGSRLGGSGSLIGQELNTTPFGNDTSSDNSGLIARSVYSPKITSPSSTTTWVAGTSVEVTWDTSNPPKQITNSKGKIVLGHLQDGTDEHLDLGHPLAQDFNLGEGRVNITVPFVSPGNDYIIVLFGDSGNRSPTFTIN